MYIYFFFFSIRRRHTRFDCDWSSDVCSSDLSLEAQKELVNSVSAFAYTPQDPGLFVVLASLERKKIAAATRELLSALVRVRAEMVSRAELTRARSNLESEFVYRKETMQGQARLLGYSQCVFGDPNYETRYLG